MRPSSCTLNQINKNTIDMIESDNAYLRAVTPAFLAKLDLIKYKAARWLQYRGFEYNKDTDRITFKFKTSSYGISFELETKAFSQNEDHVFKSLHDFYKVYNYFKELKYENI